MVLVNDVDVIKVILRAVWLLERQRGFPRSIDIADLHRDRVLLTHFGDVRNMNHALKEVLEHGVLIEVSIGDQDRLMLNTESAVRTAVQSASPSVETRGEALDDWDAPAKKTGFADAFRTYEENIGVLSPMIRENILSSLEDFTDDQITDAIRIAVEKESRSWSFVAGVLRRWAREGVPNERRIDITKQRPDEEGFSEVQLNRYMEYLREQRQRSSDQTG